MKNTFIQMSTNKPSIGSLFFEIAPLILNFELNWIVNIANFKPLYTKFVQASKVLKE